MATNGRRTLLRETSRLDENHESVSRHRLLTSDLTSCDIFAFKIESFRKKSNFVQVGYRMKRLVRAWSRQLRRNQSSARDSHVRDPSGYPVRRLSLRRLNQLSRMVEFE